MKLLLAILLFAQSQSYVFHPNEAHAKSVWFAEGGPNGGWRQVITGVPEWLRPLLRYDEVGAWEIEDGPWYFWTWEPLHDGDVIQLTARGIKVEHSQK